MEAIKAQLKKHPIAIIFYMLYMWSVVSGYLDGRETQRKIDHGEPTHVLCGIPPCLLIGSVFLIVTITNILFKKNEIKFYTCLLILIIAPIIILGNMH
jgi:hypothetical protein